MGRKGRQLVGDPAFSGVASGSFHLAPSSNRKRVAPNCAVLEFERVWGEIDRRVGSVVRRYRSPNSFNVRHTFSCFVDDRVLMMSDELGCGC